MFYFMAKTNCNAITPQIGFILEVTLMRCISKKSDTCFKYTNGQIERGNDSEINEKYKTIIYKNPFMKEKEDFQKENIQK